METVSLGTSATRVYSMREAVRDGAHSLSSSLKKKFLMGIGKLKGLKGSSKSSQRNSAWNRAPGLFNLDEDKQATSMEMPSIAISATEADISGASVAALLRQCQTHGDPASNFVGTVPLVTLEGLRCGLQSSSHAVAVMHVGQGVTGADAPPLSVTHCSRELPTAVQHRVQHCAGVRAPRDCRLPGLSFAFAAAARRTSLEHQMATAAAAAAAAGASAAATASVGAAGCKAAASAATAPAPVPAGAGAGADADCSSQLPLCTDGGRVPPVAHALPCSSVPTSSGKGAFRDGSGLCASLPGGGGGGGCGCAGGGGGGGAREPMLARALTSSASTGLWNLREAPSSGESTHMGSVPNHRGGCPFTPGEGPTPPVGGYGTALPAVPIGAPRPCSSGMARHYDDGRDIPAAASSSAGRPDIRVVISAAVCGTSTSCGSAGAGGGGGGGDGFFPTLMGPGPAPYPGAATRGDRPSRTSHAQPMPTVPGLGADGAAAGVAGIFRIGASAADPQCSSAQSQAALTLPTLWFPGGAGLYEGPEAEDDEAEEALLGDLELESDTDHGDSQEEASVGARAGRPSGRSDATATTGRPGSGALLQPLSSQRFTGPSSYASLGASSAGGALTGATRSGGTSGPTSGQLVPGAPAPPQATPFAAGLQIGSIAEAARAASGAAGAAASPAAAAAAALSKFQVSSRGWPAQASGGESQSQSAGAGARAAAGTGMGAGATCLQDCHYSGSCSCGGGVLDRSGGSEDAGCGDLSEGDGSGLQTLFASSTACEVLGCAAPHCLQATLLSLFSGHPSLQLIVEDIIRAALTGRAVVHEQLLVCPRGAPAPPATAPPAVAAAAPACQHHHSRHTLSPSPPQQSLRGPSGDDRGALGQVPADRSSHPAPPTSRNPLDDFLLLQVTACYVDRPAGHPAETHSEPAFPGAAAGGGCGAPELPSLFMSFTRPYAAAVQAAANTAPAAPCSVRSTPTAGAPTPPLSRQHTQQAQGTVVHPRSPQLTATAAAAAASVGVGAGSQGAPHKMAKSPSLGSLFGSLGRPSWMRLAAAGGGSNGSAQISHSPGPSPRPPAYTLTTVAAAPIVAAAQDSQPLHHADLETGHRPPSPFSAASITTTTTACGRQPAHNSHVCHDSSGSIAATTLTSAELLSVPSVETAAAQPATAPPPPPPLPAAAAAVLEGLCSRLRIETALLAHVPLAVTVLALDGRVVYQNGRSVSYMGSAVGTPPAAQLDVSDPDHPLQRIFGCDPPALDSMWEAVHSGRAWTGLVCMPPRVELACPAGGASASMLSDVQGSIISQVCGAWGDVAAAGGGGEAGMAEGSPGADPFLGQLTPLHRRASVACSVGSGPSRACPVPSEPSAANTAAAAAAIAAAVPVPGAAAATIIDIGAAAAPAQQIRCRGGVAGGAAFFTPPAAAGAQSLAAGACGNGGAVNGGIGGVGISIGGGRHGCSLPRNTSAPLFRGGTGLGSPLPSVLESEACTGSSADTPTGARFTGAILTHTSGAMGEASSGLFCRGSWGPRRTTPGFHSVSGAAAGSAMYGSSPLPASGDPLAASGAAAAAAGAGPQFLPPQAQQQQHLLPVQRRTRIHRSNSLAKTEHALDGSCRAMRLAASAASAASQGLLSSGLTHGSYLGPMGQFGSLAAAAAAGGIGSGSAASVEGFAVGSPRAAWDMLPPLNVSGGQGMFSAEAAAADGGGGRRSRATAATGATAAAAHSAAALPMVASAPVLLGASQNHSVASSAATAAAAAAARTDAPEAAPAAAAAAVYGGGGALWRELMCGAAGRRSVGGFRLAPSPIGRAASAPAADGLAHSISNTSLGAAALAASLPGAAALGAAGSSCCWHEIQASLILDPVSSEWQLLLINQDVTPYVQAELEVRQVLDAEHRILEEVFPRHVLEAMTLDKRRTSALGTAAGNGSGNGSGSGFNARALERSPSNASAQALATTQSAAASAFCATPPLSRVTTSGGGDRLLSAPPPPLSAAAAAAAAAVEPPPHQQRGTCSQLEASGHLGGGLSGNLGATSASLASYNYSVYTAAGGYDSCCDDRGSYSRSHSLWAAQISEPFRTLDGNSAQLHPGGAASAIPRLSRGVLAAAAAPPLALPSPGGGGGALASPGGGGGGAGLRGGIASMGDLQQYMARSHEQVTVLFADIASFTNMCGEVPPGHVMAFLNDLFTTFDTLVERHQVYKVETIGDCYMVCGGLMEQDEEGFRSVTEAVDPLHAHKVFAFAVDMLAAASSVLMPGSNQPVRLRVGIHSGPVMSGIVGRKMPRFCLFGDTVNTASRMESTGQPGAIHVSATTRALLGPIADGFDPTGGVTVKGKGFMYTYLCHPSGSKEHHSATAAAVTGQPAPPAGASGEDSRVFMPAQMPGGSHGLEVTLEHECE